MRFSLSAALAILVMLALLLPFCLAWMPADWPAVEQVDRAPATPWTALPVSVAVAAAAALLAVVVGACLAAIFVLTDFPRAGIWATALTLPFLCPPTVWAICQTYCYGSGGLLEHWYGDSWRPLIARLNAGHYVSTILVLAQIHAPLAMLIVGRGMSRLHHAGLEAARLLLTLPRFLIWLVGALKQEVAAALLLTFAMCLGNFSVPHVLQCRMVTIDIYISTINYLDHHGAMLAALPLLAVTLAATAMFAVFQRRGDFVLAQPGKATPIPLGPAVWPAGLGIAAYLVLTTLLPVSALVYECKSAGHFIAAVRDAATEIDNTLWIAAGAGLMACLAAAVVAAWLTSRAPLWAELLAMVPIGVPTLIIGLAYLRCYNHLWPIHSSGLLGGSLLVMLGLAVRGWPFATRILVTGRRRIARQWTEAACLSGMGSVRRWSRIQGPLLFDYALAAALITFVLAAGDVEISQLLCPPGGGTLALRLFTFLHFGPTHVAASLALLQLMVTIIPVAAYFLLTNRCIQVI